MGWLTGWLDDRSEAEVAADNCGGTKGMTKYQASLMPGDVGFMCNQCGKSLTGGLFGMGHCSC